VSQSAVPRRVAHVGCLEPRHLPANLSDMTPGFLDASELIVQVSTYDSMTIRSAVSAGETFRAIGYPASKMASSDTG